MEMFVSFYVYAGEEGESNEEGPVYNPEDPNCGFLYDELDLLVRQLFFQLVEAH